MSSTAMLWAHVLLGLGAVPVGLYTWWQGDAVAGACCAMGMLFVSSFFKPDSPMR